VTVDHAAGVVVVVAPADHWSRDLESAKPDGYRLSAIMAAWKVTSTSIGILVFSPCN